MSLKTLVNDPRFAELTPEEQKRAIVSMEPRAAQLPPEDYGKLVSGLQKTTWDNVKESVSMVPTAFSAVKSKIAIPPLLNPKLYVDTLKGVGKIGMALSTPIDTAKTIATETIPDMAKLAAGTIQKFSPPGVEESMKLPDYKAYPEALGNYFKSRWWGTDNALKTINDDPLGAILDASLLLPGAGKIKDTGIMKSIGGRLEKSAEAVGNKFLAGPDFNTAIKSAKKYGKPTPGDNLMKHPLGLTKESVAANSEARINELENQIQAMIRDTSEKAKASVVPTAPPTVDPNVLPSGGNIQRFAEPKVGTIPSYVPEELNLTTVGKRPGLFNPEDPAILEQQTKYVNQARREQIDALKRYNQREARNPLGENNPYAISSDDIAKSLDELSTEMGKTGTKGDKVSAIKTFKDEFLANHPPVADTEYWNDIKRSFHRQLTDRDFAADTTRSLEKKVDQTLASAVRRRLEEKMPGIKDLNAEQGAHLTINDLVNNPYPSYSKNILTGLIGDLVDSVTVGFGKGIYKTGQAIKSAGKVLPPLKTIIAPSRIAPAFERE